MKSPLKSAALRNPGESLEKYIHRYVNDNGVPWLVGAFFVVFLAGWEWAKHLTGLPPLPWALSFVAVVVVALAVHKIRQTRRRIRSLRQGAEGEKTVGQFLERLRARDAQVFHDVPRAGFNVDHVVVHASGVYVIETKTYSRPDKGRPTIRFDGERVIVGRRTPKRDPVNQVRAAASWVRDLLAESTGKTLPVRPVVVFPGWFVEPTAEARNSDVWVLNPKALPSFIEHSNGQLSESDVKLAAFHLSRYVRTHVERDA